MTLPAFLFGILVSTLYGALFHFLLGGGIGRLFLYILLSWIGFWCGQAVANWTGWTILSAGSLHLGLASMGSALFMLAGYWLGKVRAPEK
jgi:hypothetical protein